MKNLEHINPPFNIEYKSSYDKITNKITFYQASNLTIVTTFNFDRLENVTLSV